MSDRYAIIDMTSLNQEILDASTTSDPYNLKISRADGEGVQYALLRFNGKATPLCLFNLLPTLKTEAEVREILETDALWTDLMDPADKAIHFNGTSGHVNFGDNFPYETTAPFSISVWFNPEDFSGLRCIFSKATNDGNTYGLQAFVDTNGNFYGLFKTTSGAHTRILTEVATAGVFNCLVLTYSGSQNTSGFKVYLNGVQESVAAGALAATWLYGQDFLVGRRTTGFPFLGEIRDLSAWDKELSAEEAAEIYNEGFGSDILGHSARENLDSYHRLGVGDTYPNILDSKGSVTGTMENMTANDIVDI